MYNSEHNEVQKYQISPEMQSTSALVDDDRNILTSVSIALEAEGFVVQKYDNGIEALEVLTQQPVDLVVLDIKMPHLDGMELLTRLRRVSKVPAIFLTSKDTDIDEALGLKMGADDYIRKPFSQRLLIERIRAVLRRVSSPNKDSNNEKPIIRGDLVLDPVRHLCTWQGMELGLTVTEFLILMSLAQHPGHIKSRDQLMDVAYDDNIYVDDRTIDSHIKRVRKKFREVDPNFASIETKYGLGYRYSEPKKVMH